MFNSEFSAGELKTFVNHARKSAILVIYEDIFQIDHPYLVRQSNDLFYLIDRIKKKKLYAHINLEKCEQSELAELASNLL